MSADPAGTDLTSHLRELRRRLIISVVAVAAGFAVSYAFSEHLYGILKRPLVAALPEDSGFLVFSGVIEPFYIYLKVGIVGGIVLASPVVLYEIWAFVAPGLYKGERRWFIALVACSVALFCAGALFAYAIVFPFGFKYLLGYANDELKPLLSMGLYFSFASKLLIAFGVIFQLPLGMLVAARLGLISAGRLMRLWRYALVLILVAAAILTPTPDVFNQMLMAGPLILLYGAGVVLAKLFGRERKKPPVKDEDVDVEEEETVEDGEDDD